MPMSSALIVFAASGLVFLGGIPAPAPVRTHDAFFAAETRALETHFDSVVAELRAADGTRLSQDHQMRRRELIDWLSSYRESRQFPRNDGVADYRTPIFRDGRGVLCAMAYLIERSGRSDIVDRVAASRNLARIPDLVDDASLVSWLDAHGLSVEEAARIQPAYSPPTGSDGGKIETKFLWVSTALIGVDAVATYLSVAKPSQRSVSVGLIGGVGALAVGSNHLKDEGNSRTLARATTVIGGVTTLIAFWRAVTPNAWYRVGPVGRAASAFGSVRVTPLTLPTGTIVPGVGWSATF